jgi:hypothetical protein
VWRAGVDSQYEQQQQQQWHPCSCRRWPFFQ